MFYSADSIVFILLILISIGEREKMEIEGVPREALIAYLSPEFRIILEIRKKEKEAGSWTGCYLEELVERMKGIASRSTIHESLGKLSDSGVIVGTWQKTDRQGKKVWVLEYRLAGEVIREWIDRFYSLFFG